MFKRATWTVVGYGLGVGSSIYVQRRVRRAVERYTPEHVRREVTQAGRRAADRARVLGADAVAAVREGRATMRSAEIDLRDQYLRAPPPQPRRVSAR